MSFCKQLTRILNPLAFVFLAVSPWAARAGDLPVLHCTGSDAVLVQSAEGLPAAAAASASTGTRLFLSNGIDVTIHSSEELKSSLIYKDGFPIITLSGGRYLPVITDIEDPSIYNKGDGEFHPFPEDLVIAALENVTHRNLDLDVEVYILPYPRCGLLVSSANGKEVFLSPHVLEIQPSVVSYIVAHELGHVFQHVYLPESSSRFVRYKSIRGIENQTVFSSSSSHPYRPVEIFAEDFRVLFGGEEAAYGGRIENPELPSPLLVAGLEDYLGGIGGTPIAATPKVLASNYPNPFNPDTEIRITVPEEVVTARKRVSVRIYDVAGALVKELYSEVPEGENLQVPWDGRDSRGNLVASSNYFAVVQAGPARATLKLVLLK